MRHRCTTAQKRGDENTLDLFHLIYSITLLSVEFTLFLILFLCMLLYSLRLEERQRRQPLSEACHKQSPSSAYLDSFLDSLGGVETAQGLIVHF